VSVRRCWASADASGRSRYRDRQFSAAALTPPSSPRESPVARWGASGLGRRLLAFAEAEALRRGYREIRLYTHQTMVENQRLYASIGYEETGRGIEAGYDRVFMRKQLID
jgi:hypothetical protein